MNLSRLPIITRTYHILQFKQSREDSHVFATVSVEKLLSCLLLNLVPVL